MVCHRGHAIRSAVQMARGEKKAITQQGLRPRSYYLLIDSLRKEQSLIRDLACLSAGGFPARLTRSNPRGLGWIMALGQKMGCALQASMGLRAASQGRALQASMGLRVARPSVLSRGLRSWQPHTEAGN